MGKLSVKWHFFEYFVHINIATSGFICQIAVIQGLDGSTRVIRRTIPPIGQNLIMQNPGEQYRKYIWLDVFYRFSALSHWLCHFLKQKWTHSNLNLNWTSSKNPYWKIAPHGSIWADTVCVSTGSARKLCHIIILY